MVPTLTVHTLTVPTLMVHLVAPNVLLNRFKEHDPDSNPDRSRGKPFKPLHFYLHLGTNRFTKRRTMSGVES